MQTSMEAMQLAIVGATSVGACVGALAAWQAVVVTLCAVTVAFAVGSMVMRAEVAASRVEAIAMHGVRENHGVPLARIHEDLHTYSHSEADSADGSDWVGRALESFDGDGGRPSRVYHSAALDQHRLHDIREAMRSRGWTSDCRALVPRASSSPPRGAH